MTMEHISDRLEQMRPSQLPSVILGEGQSPKPSSTLPGGVDSDQTKDISAITPGLTQALGLRVNELGTQNQALAEKNAQLVTQNDELEKDNRGLRVRLTSLTDQYEASQQANQALQTRIKELEAEISNFGNRFVGIQEFVETAIHSLRTPLTALLGTAQILERKESDLFKLKLIGNIVGSTRRMGSVVTEVTDSLSVFKEPEPQIIEINSLIESAVGIQTSLMQNENIKTVINPSEQPVNVYVDPKQFGEAFSNLYVNSIHATSEHPDGQITISVETEDEMVIIGVEDNGTGMSEEEQVKCFDKYFSTKKGTKHQGSGIGLAITREIIEKKHGGKIELVWSKQGVGTRFNIHLPIHRAA